MNDYYHKAVADLPLHVHAWEDLFALHPYR